MLKEAGERYVDASRIARDLGRHDEYEVHKDKAISIFKAVLKDAALMIASGLQVKGATEIAIKIGIIGPEFTIKFDVATLAQEALNAAQNMPLTPIPVTKGGFEMPKTLDVADLNGAIASAEKFDSLNRHTDAGEAYMRAAYIAKGLGMKDESRNHMQKAGSIMSSKFYKDAVFLLENMPLGTMKTISAGIQIFNTGIEVTFDVTAMLQYMQGQLKNVLPPPQ